MLVLRLHRRWVWILQGFALSILASLSVQAQDRVPIQFQPGATSTTINGTVRGNHYIDYIVNARGGQTMVVSLAVTGTNGNGTAYFNILPAGQDYGGPYTGNMDDDNRAEVTVPSTGDWAIRVYLMGNDRDTDKTVGFSIDVYIAPGSGGGSGSSAGSPSGSGFLPEEDFFIVNLTTPGDTLNVRNAPRPSGQLLDSLPNGTVVRNAGGCTISDGRQWCNVQPSQGGVQGWVAARFLKLPGPGGENTATADDGGGAMAGSGTGPVRVQFAAGTSGAELTGQLLPGESRRYILGASNGQNLYFRLAANGPGMFYQIFNPDSSFLLDQMTSDREYRGQLWQSGDHVIEVINRANGAQSYNVIFGIQ
jgi:hypothetical protein